MFTFISLLWEYQTIFTQRWLATVNKKNVKDKCALEYLFQQALKLSFNQTYLECKISCSHQINQADVRKASYLLTNHKVFGMLLFTQTYLYLGRKLKLPSGFDTVFWKRYGQAQVNLQLCFFHYDVDTVLQALCTRINSILDRPTDPLDLIKSIQAHSGNEMLAALVKKRI